MYITLHFTSITTAIPGTFKNIPFKFSSIPLLPFIHPREGRSERWGVPILMSWVSLTQQEQQESPVIPLIANTWGSRSGDRWLILSHDNRKRVWSLSENCSLNALLYRPRCNLIQERVALTLENCVQAMMLGMMNVCLEHSHGVAGSSLSLMPQNLTESTVRLQGKYRGL